MARKCILCGKEYNYCKSCKKDFKLEPWHTLYDTENCKDISKALTDYNFKRITKYEACEILSKCDLTVELNEHYRGEIDEIMAKPRRGARAKMNIIVDEFMPLEPEVIEEVIKEAAEEPVEVVVTE